MSFRNKQDFSTTILSRYHIAILHSVLREILTILSLVTFLCTGNADFSRTVNIYIISCALAKQLLQDGRVAKTITELHIVQRVTGKTTHSRSHSSSIV